jgi:hypothetical protein
MLKSTNPISKPLLERAQDNWRVKVFPHPLVKKRFCFVMMVGKKAQANPVPIAEDHPYFFGCCSSPQEALKIGLEEVKSLTAVGFEK